MQVPYSLPFYGSTLSLIDGLCEKWECKQNQEVTGCQNQNKELEDTYNFLGANWRGQTKIHCGFCVPWHTVNRSTGNKVFHMSFRLIWNSKWATNYTTALSVRACDVNILCNQYLQLAFTDAGWKMNEFTATKIKSSYLEKAWMFWKNKVSKRSFQYMKIASL